MLFRSLSLVILFGLLIAADPLRAGDLVGTEYVPPKAAVAVLLKPKAVATSPLLEMAPWEIISVKTKELIGVSIEDVESVLVVASPPGASGIPEVGAVVRLTQPTALESLFPSRQNVGELKLVTWEGTDQKYLQGSEQFGILPIDDKTYLLGMPETIKTMLAQQSRPADSPLADRLRNDLEEAELQAFVAVEPIREMAQFLLSDARFASFPQLKELPGQLSHAQLIADLDVEQGGITLKLTATNEDDAQRLKQSFEALLDSAVDFVRRETKPRDEKSPEGDAIVRYTDRISNNLRTTLAPTRSGDQVVVTTQGKPGMSPQVLIASGTAYFLPLIESMQSRAYRSRSMNNLKHVMLAFHNYFEVNREMPADSYDAEGNPLLSWRVHILPYIEQQALYNRFCLDEPWDSEHNSKLIPLIPTQLTTPDDTAIAAEGKTRYMRPLGENLPASKRGQLRFHDITDGTSNTIAIVEAPGSEAVAWTKPADFKIDMDNPAASLMPGDTQSALGGRYDGSIRVMSKDDYNNATLKALLTHAGGEVVNE